MRSTAANKIPGLILFVLLINYVNAAPGGKRIECSKPYTLFADFGSEGGRAKQRPGESTMRSGSAQMQSAYLLTPIPHVRDWPTLSFASKKEGSFIPFLMFRTSTDKTPTTKDTIYTASSVLKIMKRVGDWQLQSWKTDGFRHKKTDWTNAALYTGLFDLGKVSKDEKYDQALVETGNDVNWNTGSNRLMADDYCVGQTYSLLYMKYKEPKMIAPFRHLADSIVNLPFSESLEWKNNIQSREWAWCDALFMGPTALAYLSTATGNYKYLDKAAKLWWKTTDYLYDTQQHLYSRDGSYLNKKEKNGAKVFWSRGNGWVLAGLARVIENMPADYPERQKFVDQFKDMAAKIASVQQADGSWHASLLDPASYPIKETSGTGFYCYAILWGLNHGILNKGQYLPVAKKAWMALITSVQPDGMLGYVQPIGGSPDKVTEQSNEVYGTGAFLLAGAQLFQYINKEHGKL